MTVSSDLQAGQGTVATRFRKINVAKSAEGLGAFGHIVKKPGELKRLLAQAIASGKSLQGKS